MRTARERLEEFASATAQKNINLDVLNEIAFPLPPYVELKEILAMLDDCAVAGIQLESKTDPVALHQSILHAAFTGQLVPQDPADEPAAALLGRLRTGTAAAPLGRTRRRRLKATV